MDKNTITGLVLIAILLVGFSFLSRPSQEQLEAQQRYYDSIAQVLSLIHISEPTRR